MHDYPQKYCRDSKFWTGCSTSTNLKYAIHAADQLLYQAKHSGRNQIGFEPAQSILDVSH
jgi:hypothetical protein